MDEHDDCFEPNNYNIPMVDNEHVNVMVAFCDSTEGNVVIGMMGQAPSDPHPVKYCIQKGAPEGV